VPHLQWQTGTRRLSAGICGRVPQQTSSIHGPESHHLARETALCCLQLKSLPFSRQQSDTN